MKAGKNEKQNVIDLQQTEETLNKPLRTLLISN